MTNRVNEKLVNLPRAQTRAAFVPGTFNAEKRTVDVVWSTGARGPRWDWDIGRYYEELSMDPAHVKLERLNAGASVLNSHQSRDLSAVIGAIVPGSAVADGKEGRATVLFSEREDVAPFVKDVEAGVIRHISVGYAVSRYELVDKVQEGDDLIPVYRATDWEPAEISFVPIPFDMGAQARAAEGSERNTCVFINRAAPAQMGESTMDKEDKGAAGQPTAAEIEQREAAAREAGQRAERERQAEIRKAVSAAKLDDAFASELIDGGIAIDAARVKIIDKLASVSEQNAERGQHKGGAVETVADERDKFLRGASDWIMQKSGVAPQMERAGHKVQPGEFRGLTLVDLARMVLERAGVNTRGMDKMTLVGRALTLRTGNYQSTSDFAVLLENTMHKVLQAAYAITPDTWSRFCAVGSVSDFRAHNRYMMGTFGSLDALKENGEFKRKSIPDGQKETITAATKGNIIGLTRQAIVNDDMDAFNRLAMMLGRAAKLSIEVDVYAAIKSNSGLGPVLNDGKTLFHADHFNIGTGAALAMAAIEADSNVLASQTDISGNEVLDLRPKVLLLPKTLGGTARSINEAQYDPDTANKLQKPNTVRGLFDDIVDTARLTGTRRYLFADPSVAPVLEVAFLDGQREPVLESQDGWNIDGTEWKVRIDYAVGGVGYHGAVTNAGVGG